MAPVLKAFYRTKKSCFLEKSAHTRFYAQHEKYDEFDVYWVVTQHLSQKSYQK